MYSIMVSGATAWRLLKPARTRKEYKRKRPLIKARREYDKRELNKALRLGGFDILVEK